MMMFKLLLLLLACSLPMACSHAPRESYVREAAVPVVTGNVSNSSVLIKGGDLSLLSFRAGPQAEDNEELDKISGVAINSIKKNLDAQNTALHVMTDESQEQPQMFLQGYVQEYSKRSRRHKIVLTGEIWLKSNGQRVLSFSAEQSFDSKKEKVLEVVYHMGQAIGDFIVRQMQ